MKKDKKEEKKDNKDAEGQPSLVEEKTKLAEDYLDQLQRVQADFENYRKRMVKEKEDFRKYVLEDVLYELLAVIDNIQRAVEASKQNHSYESLIEGISIVEKQFLDALKSQGVKPIEAKLGDKFDPHMHHAVGHEPSSDYPVDTIIKILQPGYNIAGRILRPVMVVVSSGIKDEVEGDLEQD